MFPHGIPSNPDVTTAEWSPLAARYTAPYTFDTGDDGKVVLLAAYARVDAGWASGGSTTTYPIGLPPQAHVVRARTDPHYHAENAGHVIGGHVWWYSAPRCYYVGASPDGGQSTTSASVPTDTPPVVSTSLPDVGPQVNTTAWPDDDTDENDAADDRSHGAPPEDRGNQSTTVAAAETTTTRTSFGNHTGGGFVRTTPGPSVIIIDTAATSGDGLGGSVSAVAIGAFAMVVLILVGGTLCLLHRARRGTYALVTNAESFNPLWSVDDADDSWENGSDDEDVVVKRGGRGGGGGGSGVSEEQNSLEEYYRWSMRADDVAGMAAAIGDMSPTDIDA